MSKQVFFNGYDDKPNGDGGYNVNFIETTGAVVTGGFSIDHRHISYHLHDPAHQFPERRAAYLVAVEQCPDHLKERMKSLMASARFPRVEPRVEPPVEPPVELPFPRDESPFFGRSADYPWGDLDPTRG